MPAPSIAAMSGTSEWSATREQAGRIVLRVPSFIATLATSGVVSAVALLVSDERTITLGDQGRADLSWINAGVSTAAHSL